MIQRIHPTLARDRFSIEGRGGEVRYTLVSKHSHDIMFREFKWICSWIFIYQKKLIDGEGKGVVEFSRFSNQATAHVNNI